MIIMPHTIFIYSIGYCIIKSYSIAHIWYIFGHLRSNNSKKRKSNKYSLFAIFKIGIFLWFPLAFDINELHHLAHPTANQKRISSSECQNGIKNCSFYNIYCLLSADKGVLFMWFVWNNLCVVMVSLFFFWF